MDYYENSLQHLLAELERIDLLIAAQISRARQLFAHDEQFRGLYITEEEVDALLKEPLGFPRWSREAARREEVESAVKRVAESIDLRKEESLRRGVELRLPRIARLFGLDRFEVDAFLVCFAVELDLRYERLYAYLQDDVTKKRPSVDLVLGLLAPSAEAKFEARGHFAANAPLLRHQILEFVEDPSQPHPPLLAKYLKVDDRISRYLLGSDDLDDRIQPYAILRDPRLDDDALLVNEDARVSLGRFIGRVKGGGVIYLRGPYGVGRLSTAEAVCREQGIGLLVADLEVVRSNGGQPEKIFGLIRREATLQEAAVYWKRFDSLLEEQNGESFGAFLRDLRDQPALTFLAGDALWEPADSLRGMPFARVELPRPPAMVRSRIWASALDSGVSVDPDLDIGALATKFKFTGGQIRDAAATTENLARLRNSEDCRISTDDLYDACRLHSNQKLTALARKISPRYRWNDIVLPPDRFEQLREICNHVKYRDRVYGDWGFDEKLSLGKGLSVLFAGPSGTGKTMAAEIIAGELGLEMYKIDLSTVVSKYIGDTEKNLSKIFTEAETSNAILFFDEADALFGKRSEVKDSHDRYANIETGYLLQRMEEYEGIVILATNLRKNMDEAFVRRLHFTVEFPFPDEADRRRIWEGIWPDDTPRDPALDMDFIARRFEVSGGNIRNIALAAAFLAADTGNLVEMSHLLRATKREYQKMGKVISQGEFGESPRPAIPL